MPTTSGDAPRLDLALDIPLTLSGDGSQSRRVQIALRDAIVGGRLAPGSRLPSSRSLAQQLDVSRNAIVVAYETLQADGLIDGKTGAGSYVATRLPSPAAGDAPVAARVAMPRSGPLALGRSHIDPALMQRLGSALRRQALAGDAVSLGYGDPRGSLRLRQRLAEHLAATRGLHCDADRLLITTGTQQALRLIAEALLQRGDTVGIEDPCYPMARQTLTRCGLNLLPIPIDAQGLDIGAAADLRARAVYVTPSNQFPTGVTMALARRAALIEWARRHDAWIIEDDYDNEFRYEGPPLTALAGLGADRVLYLGTFSKTLFAGLRLAYLVLPAALVEPVCAVRMTHDRFAPTLLEGAVADLMADGSLAAHNRRMRSRYRRARDLLASALHESAGDALQLSVPAQGLHLLACLPVDAPAGLAERIRHQAGLDVWLLSETRIADGGTQPDGFVLGFAGHDDEQIRQAARALGEATVALSACPSTA